jgi:hypothetical protein
MFSVAQVLQLECHVPGTIFGKGTEVQLLASPPVYTLVALQPGLAARMI